MIGGIHGLPSMRAGSLRQGAVAGIARLALVGRLAIAFGDGCCPVFARGKLSRCPPCFRPLAHLREVCAFFKEARR